jgi:CTP:molybdopterin cytidylyltransferase MocA
MAAVILAAGASTRLGEPKQLAMLGGETLLERAVRVAREAGCRPVVVVLGAEAERIRAACALGDAVVAINQRWSEGMATSIRCGLAALSSDAGGALLMTCDQPAVTAVHLRALMATGEVTASKYAGRRGVPAYFPAAWFAALSKLAGDAGARELLRDVRTVELAGGALDVDTPETLEEARRRYS